MGPLSQGMIASRTFLELPAGRNNAGSDRLRGSCKMMELGYQPSISFWELVPLARCASYSLNHLQRHYLTTPRSTGPRGRPSRRIN